MNTQKPQNKVGQCTRQNIVLGRKWSFILFLAFLIPLKAGADAVSPLCVTIAPTNTPTKTPSRTPTSTFSPTPSSTPSQTATRTFTPTETWTFTSTDT